VPVPSFRGSYSRLRRSFSPRTRDVATDRRLRRDADEDGIRIADAFPEAGIAPILVRAEVPRQKALLALAVELLNSCATPETDVLDEARGPVEVDDADAQRGSRSMRAGKLSLRREPRIQSAPGSTSLWRRAVARAWPPRQGY
jgi:hypothetical protein